ncbi:hypothetical protein LNP74_30735 [Klebsiella pneumoniae subsp. pneumoniae]|nr:hypothetical protein [Klebsiella pneumoniae subsp. pneumoniae]
MPVDWLAVIFNPSFPTDYCMQTVAAFLSKRAVCRRLGGLGICCAAISRRRSVRCSRWR